MSVTHADTSSNLVGLEILMTQKRRIRLVNILPIYRMYDNQITFTKTELSSCLPTFTYGDIGVDFIIKEY
jgi:hypothetical protein